MNNKTVKWLIVGLAGAMSCLLLVGSGTLALIYFVRTNLLAENGRTWNAAAPDANEEEARKARKKAEAAAESARLAELLGLEKIYEPVYLFNSEHGALFHDQDFAGVETRLVAARAKATTPFERYRYASILDDLARLCNDDDLEQMMTVADAWVAAAPESYLPLLTRGKLNLACAWHYRGSGFANEVSPEGWKKFELFNKKAWDDLNAARQINQDDAEIPATLLKAAAGIGKDLKTIRRYYDETIALNPHHVAVRYTMLNYLRPVWYGSWEAMDAFIAENEAAIQEFPFLCEFQRDTSSYMRSRGEAYEGVWNSEETMRKAAAAYAKQVELTPEEPTVLGSAAHFAVRSGDLASAVDYFERIGNRYPVVDEFPSLYNYHWWRIYALAEHSDDPGVIGTPREKELLDAARALQPSHSTTNGLYLAYLARTRDDAQTTAFWESLDDVFFKTGDLGSPPDYSQLEAMAMAARSRDYGIQGTERERALLDQALALAPDNALVRLAYAGHFMGAKDYEQARPHLERARELDPAYLPALHTLGWLNYHQKRWDEGIATATEFLAAGPSKYVTDNTEDVKEIIALCEKKKAEAAAE